MIDLDEQLENLVEEAFPGGPSPWQSEDLAELVFGWADGESTGGAYFRESLALGTLNWYKHSWREGYGDQ